MKRNLLLTILLALLLGTPASPQTTPGKEGVKVVVIDAGHGGHDPGNLGTRRYKTREKDIALAVALKLGDYIKENYKNVKVVYTRDKDVFVELKERANIANAADADLFISIHCDAFTNSAVSGATTFVLGRSHNDENMRVARRENSVILLEENYEEKYEGFDPRKPETLIALTLMQNAFLHQSISFAQKVQDQFRERVQRKDRGVKQQPLYVTSRTAMPAVLVELGFLTNPVEEDFLNSEEGQAYMASAIYRAFRDYKEERDAISQIATHTDSQPVNENSATVINKDEAAASPATISSPPDPGEKLQQAYYSVQIVTSGLKKELSPANFKGVEGVSFYEEGGLYKYIVGKTRTLGEAEALKQKMKETGFKDAFVVALSNGNRITISEAKELLQ